MSPALVCVLHWLSPGLGAAGTRNFGVHLVPVEGVPASGGVVIDEGAAVQIIEYDEERRAEWAKLFGHE